MLVISRQTDYAARILLHLSIQPEGAKVTAHEIAACRLVPEALLRHIVTQLAVAGLVKTARGKAGGIVLARPPGDISLLDVVEAMEGPPALNSCTVDPSACAFGAACSVHEAWMAAHAMLVNHLRHTTFAGLAHPAGATADAIGIQEKGVSG